MILHYQKGIDARLYYANQHFQTLQACPAQAKDEKSHTNPQLFYSP